MPCRYAFELMELASHIEKLLSREAGEFGHEYFRAFDELKAALSEGRARRSGLPAPDAGFLFGKDDQGVSDVLRGKGFQKLS